MNQACSPADDAGAVQHGAQLRYDALISLVAKWNRVSSVDEAARAFVADVKFVLSLDAWRLVVREDDAAVAIEGTRTHTHVLRGVSQLPALDVELLDRGAPLLMTGADLEERERDIAPSLRDAGLATLYAAAAPGPTGRNEHVLFVGTTAGALTTLDLKFAGLVGGLFADKVRQLRARERLSDAYESLAERDARLHADLVEGRAFQQSLLPVARRVAELEIATVFEPVDLVGGDVYDIAVLPHGRLRIFLIDATGHGVRAALRTMVLLSEYNALKYRAATPGHLLRALNARLLQHRSPLELLSPAVCVDICRRGDGHDCVIASASAPATLLASRDGGHIVCDGGSMLLGMREEVVLEEATVPLETGDRLLLATDGLYEQRDPGRRLLGYDACLRALASGATLPESVAAMRLLFDAHRGIRRRDDDVTAIFVGVTAGEEAEGSHP
jgi:serine phosphatase RsbU (regulator of sigma subunit)